MNITGPIEWSKPQVQLPGDNRLLSVFAADLGKVLARTNIFQRCGLAYTVNHKGDGLTPMTAEMLRSWAEQFVTCFKVRRLDDSGPTLKYCRTMTSTDAEGVLNAPQFIAQLQEIERFNPVRMPTLRPGGSVELLPEGYDAASKTFTASNAMTPVHRIQLTDARAIIDGLLSEFAFADAGRSKAVALGAMLSVYGFGLLPKKSLRPCFMLVANAEGAGKTLLVKVCTVPVLGYVPTGCKPKDEDEMRKVLLSSVMEAKPVLFFDNFKGRLSSESLEGFLTSQDWAGRILGGNKTFSGENNVTVFITGNGCTVSPDMRRRSLFCELFLETDRAEDRVFRQALEVPLLLERRWEILCALWTFVCEWTATGCQPPKRSHSGFPAWAAAIGGIVEAAGYGCPLETPTVAVDTDGEDMRTLVGALSDGALMRAVEFDEVVKAAKSNGLFEWLIPDGDDLDAKSRAKFASLLKGYDRRLVGGFRFSLSGKGHSRRFTVEKVTQ